MEGGATRWKVNGSDRGRVSQSRREAFLPPSLRCCHSFSHHCRIILLKLDKEEGGRGSRVARKEGRKSSSSSLHSASLPRFHFPSLPPFFPRPGQLWHSSCSSSSLGSPLRRSREMMRRPPFCEMAFICFSHHPLLPASSSQTQRDPEKRRAPLPKKRKHANQVFFSSLVFPHPLPMAVSLTSWKERGAL